MFLTSPALAGKIFTTSTTGEALSSPLAFSVFSFLLLPPWRRKWQPIPVLLPGKSHGRRILVGYSPWGRKESDTTERLNFNFTCCVTSGQLLAKLWFPHLYSGNKTSCRDGERKTHVQSSDLCLAHNKCSISICS